MPEARNVLVDGNNLLHRAHAVFVENRSLDPLLSPTGYPTGLIYGFLSMLSDWVISVSRPTSMSVFFDGVPRRRLALDPDYKKREDDRPRPGSTACPITLSDGFCAKNELDILSHLFRLMGSDVYHHSDEEADDLIASYVSSRPSDFHVIISSDRDYYQLLADSDKVVLYRPGVSGARFFDAEKAVEDMRNKYDVGIRPSEILMFKALTGDVSDNIPGVPRLRKKVAAPLCHHRNVDDLMATGLPGFSKSEREKTESLRDRIATNLRLVALNRDIEIGPSRMPAIPDFMMAGKVLREDLGITAFAPSIFQFDRSSTARYGDPSGYNTLPDFLRDI